MKLYQFSIEQGGSAIVPEFDDAIITMMTRFMNVGVRLMPFPGFSEFVNNLLANGDQGNVVISICSD